MKSVLLLSLALSLVTLGQQAQPLKHVRFVPLGELPPHQETIKDGIRIQLPPPPGSVPPNPTVLAEDAQGGFAMNLRLKMFTDLYSIKPAAGGVKIYEGKVIGGKPWISSRFPAKNQTLGILYRDHQKMTWFDPVMKVVPDDLASFPLGTVRFANVSQFSALVRLGEEQTDIVKPGEVLIKKLKVGNNPMLLGYLLPNNAQVRIFQNDFILRPKQRIQAFFYKAQGNGPRKDVKMFYRSEFFVPPPKPKKEAAVAGG